MEEFSTLLDLVMNGVSNPVMSIIGGVIMLGGFIFLKVLKKKWRTEKAEREKQKDKAKDLDELEAGGQAGSDSVRDRLKKKKT